MTVPSVPQTSTAMYRAIVRSLRGQSISEQDWRAFTTFINDEAPPLLADGFTTYLVLGSYRPPYIPQVNQVQHELNRRPKSHSIKIGDMIDPKTSDAPEFRIKFHLAATLEDWIVGVYEQEAGGEAPELGKLSEVYPTKTYVLPRDVSIEAKHIEKREEALATATALYFDEETAHPEKKKLLQELVTAARSNGADISGKDIADFLLRRGKEGYKKCNYSWVHLQEFQFFDRNRRCLPWTTDEGHRLQARRVPHSPPHK